MRTKRLVGWSVLLAAALMVVVAAAALASPTPRSYRFVTVDHPVDMWKDGQDTWAYYAAGHGTLGQFAEEVRSFLTAQGFTEDATHKPWFRFVKGNVEVVLCDHSEFAVNGARGDMKLTAVTPEVEVGPRRECPCVLVKNGQGTDTSVLAFQVKKLFFRW